ncbi:putative aminotransferase-like, plant mobile domain-containing protein [Medicago truncatula]|uniref:Putative aminotransferase-like, plant mobile domain-containing protein n=1 Tax=Medicago truncatula TaxID=3880 RepID=A0A396HBI8_MEDTR|nr:protein MAIN-LIKE 1-like [Medicago truncatula]RHN50659.1 putative aminotransferase-like, plant mobile domain-containing protein [Medicago truncatula]
MKSISGYLTLIQAWVYEHFPTLCTNCCKMRPDYKEQLPRSIKWKTKRDKGLVIPFRQALDNITVDQVCWTPYVAHRDVRPLNEVSLYRGWIRWGSKMYAHLPDRVLRQYGHVQSIPLSPNDVTGHSTTLERMDVMFTQYAINVVDPDLVSNDPSACVDGYMDWFRMISHPYLIRRDPNPLVEGLTADATSLLRARQIVNTLLDKQYIAPNGIPLVNELMKLLTTEKGVEPSKRNKKKRRLR